MAKAVEVRVTGRVQGVFYRAECADEANRLGVHGWLRNDDDGAVTGRFEGPDSAVDQLLDWCRSGSRRAEVEDVSITDRTVEHLSGFETC